MRSPSSTSSGRFSRVAQVLPAERDLRRVIGDGADVPDGEVAGLDEQALLDLYRSLILLRTYDERSVVYHRQGRIGTYAIFWNHEAMQAGSVHALEDDDWIFPSYRESAIGLLRGMPAATILSWWRGHPSGWWNPADYNVASICVPIATQVPHAAGLAWGKKLRGEPTAAIVLLRRRRDVGGSVPRRRQLRSRDAGAARPLLQQQPVGDLHADQRADACRDACRQGGRLRDPGYAGRRRRRPRGVRGDARGGRACARRRRADVHRGDDVSRRAARDRGRPERVHRPRARRGGEEDSNASAATSVTCGAPACSTTRRWRRSRRGPPI